MSGKEALAWRTKVAAISRVYPCRVSRSAVESAMAVQLSPSALGSPGSTLPRRPPRVEEVHAEVRDLPERVDARERAD